MMKTKLSKKVISLLLSVLMVVTAIPMSVYATVDLSDSDSAVAAVKAQMTAFEQDLQTEGKAWTNVLPAYELYVKCQKALDAYQYGSDTSALGTLASQLEKARQGMGTYDSTPDITSQIPTFANSNSDNMKGYVGAGQPINNVLYTGQATALASGSVVGTTITLYYFNGTTLLYDGSTTAAMPIFFKANVTANKDRYVYAVYPTSQAATSTDMGKTTDAADFDVLQFTDYWCGGTQGTGSQYANVDWNWNWWSQWNGTAYHRPSYSHDTGSNVANKNTAGHRSEKLDYKTKSLSRFDYGYERTGANALAVVSAPADYGAEYSPNWYYATGDSANSNAIVLNGSSATIKVINYKTLADAITTYGAQMKSTPVSNFKEGGLSTYIAAMDDATGYDVTTNFKDNTDGYENTIQDMRDLINGNTTENIVGMKAAANDAKNHKDSTSYANLRSAVTTAIINQGELGNTGYTADSWAKFESAYTAVKNIFRALPNGTYSYTESTSDMDGMTYAQALTHYFNALVTNVEYEDTTALMNALATFDTLDNSYFTSDSYSDVKAQLDDIKIAVWGSLSNYGVTTAGPEKSDEAAALIADYAAQVPDIMKALRISPDAIAKGSGFEMSLNNAVAWEVSNVADNGMPKYSNYTTFTTAQQNLATYATELARTPFTDFDTQYAAYVAQVGTVYNAYVALKYTFFGIDDGTVANTGDLTTMDSMTHSHSRYTFTLTPSYTSSATLIKMNHEATTADFGYFYLKNNIYNSGDSGIRENNGIDSISINASYEGKEEITSKGNTSTPPAVDNAQANYPGLLASNGFSVHNFSVDETSAISNTFFARLDDSDYVYDAVSPYYDQIFGTSNGAATNPAIYTAHIREGEQKKDGYITYKANFAVDLPSSTAVKGGNFTTATGPKTYDLSYTDAKFGAFYVWNCQPTSRYAGYGAVVSSDTFYVSIHVIDASNLVDLYTYISDWLAETDSNGYTNAQKYDGVSGTNGINQRLAEASDEIDITRLTDTAITQRLNTRYTNLLNAWNAKSLKTFNVDFVYNTDATHTTTETVTLNYGETLADYASEVNAIISRAQASTYESGNYKYTFKGWADETSIDMAENITFNDTHTAIYNETLNKASFTAHDAAKAQLEAKLDNLKYSVEQLNAVNNLINGDTYYYYTSAEKADTFADAQSEIDAQTSAIETMVANLTPVSYTTETADLAAYVEKLAAYDKDMYSKSFTYIQEDVPVGNSAYDGLIYATDTDLQNYIKSVIGEVKTYDIYLNGEVVKSDVPYGTALRVNGDGSVDVVTDITEQSEGDNYAWYYCYSAPSTNNTATASKYYSTAPSYSFYVQGTTYIESVETKETESRFPITFVADINGTKTKTFAVAYADAETGIVEDMPSIPNYAGYAYSGEYTIKSSDPDAELIEEEGVWYATSPLTVVYSYGIDTAHASVNSYEIVVYFLDAGELLPLNDYETYADLFDAPSDELAPLLKFDFNYNEKVQFINEEFSSKIGEDLYGESIYAYAIVDDIDAYANGDEYALTLLSLGSEYSFYAYDNLNIIALTYYDYLDYFGTDPTITIVARDGVAPVYNTSGSVEKFTLVSSFVANENITVKECGYLFTSNTTLATKDITLESVGTNGIARMKSTKLTCGNQFVVNVKNPSTSVNFMYVPYVIYTDATGTHECYAPPVVGSNQF